jgi:hypothetical protein
MNNKIDAGAEFERKLNELQKQARPSHIGTNLKEIVLYEKLLQLESRLKMLESHLSNPVGR